MLPFKILIIFFHASFLSQCTAPCLSFTSKLPKLTQPDLNYFSPESQLSSICSPQSDMFSFGLLIISLYNNGRSLLESNLNVVQYAKQLEQVIYIVSHPVYCHTLSLFYF